MLWEDHLAALSCTEQVLTLCTKASFFSLALLSGADITPTWTSGSTLRLDWTGKFSSTAPLYYEFSLGTQMGSGSIRQWQETDQTFASITSARLNQNRDYFFTLTAVSSSGIHTTAYRMIAGMPVG